MGALASCTRTCCASGVKRATRGGAAGVAWLAVVVVWAVAVGAAVVGVVALAVAADEPVGEIKQLRRTTAASHQELPPEFVVILDTSGSMNLNINATKADEDWYFGTRPTPDDNDPRTINIFSPQTVLMWPGRRCHG